MAKSHCCHNERNLGSLKTKDCSRRKSCHCDNLSNENMVDPVNFVKPDPVCCVKTDPVYEDKCDRNVPHQPENRRGDELFSHYLQNYLGQTVTIFTTSGGVSGSGFTGVLMSIECNFLRLLSQVGSAPSCALGSCCDDFPEEEVQPRLQSNNNSDYQPENNRINCNVSSIGSVVVIPIDLIAAFVHNAVGSNM